MSVFLGPRTRQSGLTAQTLIPSFRDLRVLDLGCGEGKNAAFLASRGALVEAIDSSELALANARSAWPSAENVIGAWLIFAYAHPDGTL